MFLIGVDYSAQEGNVGLAGGRLNGDSLKIEFAECPGAHAAVEEKIVAWIKNEKKNKNGTVLLAIDAPLGWPKPLSESLCSHRAGEVLSESSDQLFMRETDRWVRDKIGKTPLKVGADKIAIQAHHALCFLNKLRYKTGPIPLAWKPGEVKGVSVIEVYPAATLKGRVLRCTGYKGKNGKSHRKDITGNLRRKKEVTIRRRGDVIAIHKNDHVFDAMLCALAAADFAKGQVISPEVAEIDGVKIGLKRAKKEGWIWVKKSMSNRDLPNPPEMVNINGLSNNRSLNMLKGSLVALITPMDEAGGVDFDALRKLVDFHAQNGTDGIVSVGTSGESATLDANEQIEVIHRTVEFAAGRVPVIAGSGANSTAEALELTSRAAALGVRACLLVVPYYNKPTQHGLYRHFRAIAEGVEVPQILYNVPGRTALDMANDTVVRLAQIPNIIGIKDASADISRVGDFLARCGDDFAVYSGDDATTLELMKAGGHGCISVTANVAPKLMHAMCAAALGGDLDESARINEELNDLHAALFAESNPIPVKWAVAELGLAPRGIRLPLTWLSEEYHGTVKAAMRRAGVLPD